MDLAQVGFILLGFRPLFPLPAQLEDEARAEGKEAEEARDREGRGRRQRRRPPWRERGARQRERCGWGARTLVEREIGKGKGGKKKQKKIKK